GAPSKESEPPLCPRGLVARPTAANSATRVSPVWLLIRQHQLPEPFRPPRFPEQSMGDRLDCLWCSGQDSGSGSVGLRALARPSDHRARPLRGFFGASGSGSASGGGWCSAGGGQSFLLQYASYSSLSGAG